MTPDSALLQRARHSAVVHNGFITVFGGWNGRRKLNDLYIHALDGSAKQLLTEADQLQGASDDGTVVAVPSRRHCATAARHAAAMRGWRICSNRSRAAGSEKTRWAIHRRSKVPSGPMLSGPNPVRISESASEPGITKCRARSSVSTTGTPRATSSEAAADFPMPMPPVMPSSLIRADLGALPAQGARMTR